jgi:hypothetical protein
MTNLKVGDRVRILDVDRSMNPSREVTDTGEVTDVNTVSPGAVRVKCDTWKNDFMSGSWFHARQLKRLKPKPKPPPQKREGRIKSVWLFDGCAGSEGESVRDLPDNGPGPYSPTSVAAFRNRPKNALYSHFVRLEHGQIIVDREGLAKAWDKWKSRSYASADESFNSICRALGLPDAKGKK